jgi:phage replication initiation protein
VILPPSCNTGGKSSQLFPVSLDWLNFTARPADTGTTPEDVAERLQMILGVDLTPRSGMHGYDFGLSHESGAVVCWGGEHQAGTMWVNLAGGAVALLDRESLTWLQFLLYDTLAKITRVDLACDFLQGEFTVDQCVQWWKEGVFTMRGRRPSTSLVGDWLEATNGRTLYIGKAKNGKLIRCYEKGIQLGQKASPWVRAELQLTAVDRVIPHDVLDDPARYFQGSANWPFVVSSAPLRIRTRVEREAVSFEKMIHETRRAYGSFIGYMDRQGFTPEEIVEALQRPGTPRRLHGLTAEQLMDAGNAEASDAAATHYSEIT